MSRVASGTRLPFRTLDGSTVTELVHPVRDPAVAQSLAQAVVAPGESTRLHRHHETEEIYYLQEGHGEMRLGAETFEVAAGDSVVIAPGTPHNIRNVGTSPLVFLCCCAPGYEHADTVLENVDD